MIGMIAHDLRMATRRAAWPVAVGLHLAGTGLFILVWGPSNGVPLWSASLLTQFVAADRVLLAVLLTWLVTPTCAPGSAAPLAAWAGVSGVPASRLMASRAAAAGILGVLMTITAAPALMVAAQIAAATTSSIVGAEIEMAAFALACVGLTAAAAAFWRHALAVWCSAMAMTAVAAFGVRVLSPGAARLSVCALVAAAGASALVSTGRRRWRWLGEAGQ